MSAYPNETIPLDFVADRAPDHGAETVDWRDERLARITRLRLLTEPGTPFWDVSYIWGVLRDGTRVNVSNPFDLLPRQGLHRAIVEQAKRDGVHAKRLGVFAGDVISKLW